MQGMQNPYHSNIRLYLVLTTVVIVAILFLVVSRNGGKSLDFTGALINSDDKNDSIGDKELDSSSSGTEKVSATREIKSFELNFDKVPKISESAKFSSLSLSFNDLSTGNFKINNNRMELNNVEGEIELDLQDFAGKVIFDEQTFSLSGKAKKIVVNNLAFSSENGIDFSFENLYYHQFNLEGIELSKVLLPAGSGNLKVGEKLDYALSNEDVTLYYFSGSLNYNKQNISELSMSGDVSKIEVDSGSLSWEWG